MATDHSDGRYLQIERADEPDLHALRRQFDDLYARMQGDEAARRMAAAFAMSPQELGETALRAARHVPATK